MLTIGLVIAAYLYGTMVGIRPELPDQDWHLVENLPAIGVGLMLVVIAALVATGNF